MKLGVFNRRTAAELVLVAWAGALAWLARREFGKGEAQSIAEATVRLNPEAHFYSVKAGGQQVGYASLTVDTVPAGFKLSEVMALDVPEADSTRRVTRRTEIEISRSLRIRSFDRTVSGGGLFEQFTGTIEGDTLLRLAERDDRNRPAEEWTIRVPGDVVLPPILPYRLAFGKRLEVGRTVGANVLDLATGTIGRVEFAATAESTFVIADSATEQRGKNRWIPTTFDTVKAWRIEHSASGTPVVDWVDQAGGLVATEAALGVRLERSAFELVSFNYRTELEKKGPAGHKLVPGMETVLEAGVRPDTGTSAQFAIKSASIEKFLLPRVAWLAGGRQVANGDELRIGARPRPQTDSTKSDFLDPRVQLKPVTKPVSDLAAKIVGTERDPERMARLLLRWVATSIRHETRLEAPILASRVLADRRAGAEGIASLFGELARASGLSARTVGGVAVIGNRAYGHAWAEVLIDGAWVAVDPTFGQMPASPALVRVTIGGTGRAIDLVPFLGSATIGSTQTVTQR